MSVNTIEVLYQCKNSAETIRIGSSLINIARGTCVLNICGAQEPIKDLGNLKIEIERSIITATLNLQKEKFNSVKNLFENTKGRTPLINLLIDTKLTISSSGDLVIEEELCSRIIDAEFICPLL